MIFNNSKGMNAINDIFRRWLSLGKCLERTLLRWDSLKSYFQSNFKLDDDPTQTESDQKPCREKRLVNAFKQPVSKLHVMSVQYVILVFDSFKTFLKDEEQLIHIFYHSIFHLHWSLLLSFTLPEVISESDYVLVLLLIS